MYKKKILIVEDEFIIADVLSNILKTAGYEVCGIADSVQEALDMLAQFEPEFVLLDIYLKGKLTGIDLAHRLTEKNIPFIYISANSNQKVLEAAKVTNPYGFVIKPFREKDVLIALDIAVYRHENNLEAGLKQNAVLQKKMAEILASGISWEQKILQMGKTLQPYIPFEFLSVGAKQDGNVEFYEIAFSRIGFDEYQLIGPAELMVITNLKSHELAQLKANDTAEVMATWYDENELNVLLRQPSLKKLLADTYNLKSHLSLPICLPGGKTVYFNFYSRRTDAYQADHLVLCNRLQQLLTSFMESILQLQNNPMVNTLHNYAVILP